MSFEVGQQKTDSTEVVPKENNHGYHLKQGKGPEKKISWQQSLMANQ